MACNCNDILFFVRLLIVKTDKYIFYDWDYVTIICLIPLYMIDQQKRILYH